MVKFVAKVAVTTLIVSLGTFVVLSKIPAFPVSQTVTQKQSFFTISGEGKVTVVPDIGIVSLGINITGDTVKTTQAKANTVINSISDKVKSLGVEAKDVETTNYSIYPQYDYQSGKNRITGYSVSANIAVTVRQLDKVNDVIDSATALGANTVGGIQFTVNDGELKKLTQTAREKAVADAKTKAQNLASAAGLSLGRLVNVEESSPMSPRPVFMAMTKDSGLGAAPESTSVQPGSTDITSSVTLSYEVR